MQHMEALIGWAHPLEPLPSRIKWHLTIADTVQPLIAFLKCLDGVKAPKKYLAGHHSKIQPENLPISQEI
jgi:hypothetical protein